MTIRKISPDLLKSSAIIDMRIQLGICLTYLLLIVLLTSTHVAIAELRRSSLVLFQQNFGTRGLLQEGKWIYYPIRWGSVEVFLEWVISTPRRDQLNNSLRDIFEPKFENGRLVSYGGWFPDVMIVVENIPLEIKFNDTMEVRISVIAFRRVEIEFSCLNLLLDGLPFQQYSLTPYRLGIGPMSWDETPQIYRKTLFLPIIIPSEIFKEDSLLSYEIECQYMLTKDALNLTLNGLDYLDAYTSCYGIEPFKDELWPQHFEALLPLSTRLVSEVKEELLAKYISIKKSYDKLEADYDGLISNYESLQAIYNRLTIDYSKLKLDYEGLKLEYESTIKRLTINTNLMYAFMVTTIISIAMAVYFAKRRTKTV
ncbi:MAG: hypothetical protein QXL27_09800 [Candidatus Bathyarchaeia archaeon]